MKEEGLQSPKHANIRTGLRILGPTLIGVGLILTVIGFVSFFSTFGTFDGPPRYFWCAFLGLPLMFVGASLSMFGFLGAFYRYTAGESAPVAKDVVNYMGENIQPAVKSVAQAAAEGILEAQRRHSRPGDPA
jgi:hypothetical protein